MYTKIPINALALFGTRLRKERKRLKFTQQEFAEIGKIKRSSQYLYENAGRPPTIEYIAHIMDVGADLQYLFLGQRSAINDDMVTLDRITIKKVLTSVDRFCRNEKGELLDLEIRNILAEGIFVALSEQKDNEINWEELPKMMDRLSA